MPFFEPLPPEDADSNVREWSPPAWDRPNEGVLGGLIPVGQVVGRSDEVVLSLDHVRAYPTGFVLALRILPNPRLQPRPLDFFGPGRSPRVGIEFSDGQKAGNEPDVGPGPFPRLPSGDVPKDDDGMPTQPVIRFTGGGGGLHTYAVDLWVYPLPPAGPLKVFVEWPVKGIPETKVVLDAEAIREAAARAVVVWE